ncbi:MAG: hypothetical protein ACJ72E_11305 [Marmoricola sp.]
MNRRMLRVSAIFGAAAISALAVAPVFAASEPVSQASAQSLQLSIGGTSAVTQLLTSTNDGKTETRNNASTLPPLAGLIPGDNALSLGVAVQQAKANADSTSYACAGIAGTGGGLVTVGTSSCNIDGKPLTVGLGSLNLDLTHLIGGDGAITSALNNALGPVVAQLGNALDGVVTQLTSALKGAGLGDIGITGGLAAVEATCTADPSGAQGDAQIVDTSGHHTIPISLTLPGVAQPLVLANLDVDLPGKPGGTDVIIHLDQATQAIINAVKDELATALGGKIATLGNVVGPILQTVQDSLVTALVNALKPALQAISDNILKLVVNDVTPGDGGKSVTATALKVVVLGGAAQFTGSALISGTIGKVTCGPNRAVAGPPTTPPPSEQPPGTPTVVDSGLSGASHTTRDVLMATTALMLLAGTAGLVGYRRLLTK